MDYNSNGHYNEGSFIDKDMLNNSNMKFKINHSQQKLVDQCYDNQNFNQMMMHQNSNNYSQMRYLNPSNNNHYFVNYNNNPLMANKLNQPIANCPPYMHSPNPVTGCNYLQMPMYQQRLPYNIHGQYMPQNLHSQSSGQTDVYMNGSSQPIYSNIKTDSVERKVESNFLNPKKKELSDSGSASTKSASARSSKSKNAIKSESHPTTPSPSQTSMSSVIDDTDGSVSSSLGLNDPNIPQHPVYEFDQYQVTPHILPNRPTMYSQHYQNSSNNIQIPNYFIGSYSCHVTPQTRPFVPSSGQQYHKKIESSINSSCFQKLLELGKEPDRSAWIERYLKFMQQNNAPINAVPTVVKQPLDLYRLYHAVRERGGLLNVVKTKRWKEICHIVNVNASASGAFTLRRNYIRCLLDYECLFDRNGVDPGPILQEIQSMSDKKKKNTTKTPNTSSSCIMSHNNPDVIVNSATSQPPLPVPDYNNHHSYQNNTSPYNNDGNYDPLNGSIIYRSPLNYPTQRSPYPGLFPSGPPRMTSFNGPTIPMQTLSPVRYETNDSASNGTKPVPMNQQLWNGATNAMSATIPNSLPNSPQIGSLDDTSLRIGRKVNYGGMPPPPIPPVSLPVPPSQSTMTASIRDGSLSDNRTSTSPINVNSGHPQYYHFNMPHFNYSNQISSNSPLLNQPRSSMIPHSRYLMQTLTSTNQSSSSNSMYPLSTSICYSRSQVENSCLTPTTYPPQYAYSNSKPNFLKQNDNLFPPNSVEATKFNYSKKRKYCSKDIKAFNPITVTMALKSGLVAEVSWALNYLNIWCQDDSLFDNLSLKNVMPMFQALMDVWRNSLDTVFGVELSIKDLELPIYLDDTSIIYELGNILKQKTMTVKHEHSCIVGDIDDDPCLVKERILETLDCEKLNNNLSIKIDYNSKLYSLFGSREEFLDFVIGINEAAIADQSNYNQRKDFSDWLEMGGWDSTRHILPPMLSQSCESDTHGSSLAKYSRCDFSPLSNLFSEIEDADEERMLRCICVSMVIRNLSFIADNDRIMGCNRSLLAVLGRLLLLGHSDNDNDEWFWWDQWMNDVREHVLVTVVNISCYIHLDIYPDSIIRPIIVGLIHWLTCQSAEAQDPLPSHRVLCCRRLALESILRLCVHDKNIDYFVSGPTKATKNLFDNVALSFCYPESQVVREMSLAVMNYLSSVSDDLGSMYLANTEPSVIGGLIRFIEVTECQIRHVVDSIGMEALRARPDLMGTSLELLRHSGVILHRMATCRYNRERFSSEDETRMLQLVISSVLDQNVAQSLSGVLQLLSEDQDMIKINDCDQELMDYEIDYDNGARDNWRYKAFLTFDNLSFCVNDAAIERNIVDEDDGGCASIVSDDNMEGTNDEMSDEDGRNDAIIDEYCHKDIIIEKYGRNDCMNEDNGRNDVNIDEDEFKNIIIEDGRKDIFINEDRWKDIIIEEYVRKDVMNQDNGIKDVMNQDNGIKDVMNQDNGRKDVIIDEDENKDINIKDEKKNVIFEDTMNNNDVINEQVEWRDTMNKGDRMNEVNRRKDTMNEGDMMNEVNREKDTTNEGRPLTIIEKAPCVVTTNKLGNEMKITLHEEKGVIKINGNNERIVSRNNNDVRIIIKNPEENEMRILKTDHNQYVDGTHMHGRNNGKD